MPHEKLRSLGAARSGKPSGKGVQAKARWRFKRPGTGSSSREGDLSQKIEERSSGNEKGERRWLTPPFPSQAMALGWPP